MSSPTRHPPKNHDLTPVAHRIPFYTPAKTLFLLYLSLPYTQGSSYIYTNHLHPFLLANEPEIDLKIGEVRGQAWECLARAGRAALLWVANIVGVGDGVAGAGVGLGDVNGSGAGAGLNGGPGGLNQPPSAAHAQTLPPTSTAAMMMSTPAQALLGLWRVYGPQIAAFVEPTPEHVTMATRQAQQHASTSTSTSTSRSAIRAQTTTQSPLQSPMGTSTAVDRHHDLQHNHAQILARRRALEAELAALPPVPTHGPSSSMSSSMTASTSTPTSAPVADSSSPSNPFFSLPLLSPPAPPPSGDANKGKYVEVRRDDDDGDLFGDVDVVDDGGDREENGGGSVGAGGGRFWWWGGESRAGGYERVKTE